MSKTMSDVFAQERALWLENARAAARELLDERTIITIEDVLKVCPRPKFLHKNVTGHVFNSPDFVSIGWRKSARPAMNGRCVRTWRLKYAEEYDE